MKNQKPKPKAKTKTIQTDKPNALLIQFSKVSPTMLFRAVVLLATLIVATIAIRNEIQDSNVWSFLGSVVFYTALTTKSDIKDK